MIAITWDILVAKEPRLESLARTAATCRGDDWRAWVNVKATLSQLVGWGARRDDDLASASAYDIAHAHLLAIFERRPTSATGTAK